MIVGEGQLPFYRPNESNECPSCKRRHWLVGRTGAECANERCGMVLPFQRSETIRGVGVIWRFDNNRTAKQPHTRRTMSA